MKLNREDRREQMGGIGALIILICIVIGAIVAIVQGIYNVL
jgi:archaellin